MYLHLNATMKVELFDVLDDPKWKRAMGSYCQDTDLIRRPSNVSFKEAMFQNVRENFTGQFFIEVDDSKDGNENIYGLMKGDNVYAVGFKVDNDGRILNHDSKDIPCHLYYFGNDREGMWAEGGWEKLLGVKDFRFLDLRHDIHPDSQVGSDYVSVMPAFSFLHFPAEYVEPAMVYSELHWSEGEEWMWLSGNRQHHWHFLQVVLAILEKLKHHEISKLKDVNDNFRELATTTIDNLISLSYLEKRTLTLAINRDLLTQDMLHQLVKARLEYLVATSKIFG